MTGNEAGATYVEFHTALKHVTKGTLSIGAMLRLLGVN